jgi:hypothetical protein
MEWELSWWKDLVSIVVLLIGIPFTIKSFQKIKHDISGNLAQRKLELKWKKSDAGKKLMDEFLDSCNTKDARDILEYPSGFLYGGKENSNYNIGEPEMLLALDTKPAEGDQKQTKFIRERFDSMLFQFGIFEHHIKRELIDFDDVYYPANYYVKKMNKNKGVFIAYIIKYEFLYTLPFLERFKDEWN